MKFALIATAALLAVSGVASADQALAQKKACMSCHQLDKKVVGPAFKDIAAKKKSVAELATFIQKGGKGNWGPVPMPPQPSVSADEAKKLAEWIHGLK